MRFLYLRDPLFRGCLALYIGHKVLVACGASTPLLRGYLNDLICVGFWVPIMLSGMRVVGVRPHDEPPRTYEVVIPLLLWAVVFEVLLPALPRWSGLAVPDPNDVLSYALGAMIAVIFWNRRYAPPQSAPY